MVNNTDRRIEALEATTLFLAGQIDDLHKELDEALKVYSLLTVHVLTIESTLNMQGQP